MHDTAYKESTLVDRFKQKDATIGVVGMGYVGLPLMMAFVRNGFHGIGFDIDTKKNEILMRGESYIKHLGPERVKAMVDTERFRATSDFSLVRRCDAILIAVPTPLNKNREPDMAYITGTCEALMPYVRPGQLFVLESTTYPGTTQEVMVPILEKSGLKEGKDFWVAFSPEREDPARTDFTTETIPKVVGADSKEGLELATTLYGQVIAKVVPVSSTKAAEATKILENTFRAVNIALVNELKIAFMKMGIDIWEVIEAAKTKPFGFMPFYPGPGLGGHCIPIDPFYLTWKAREYGVHTKFIELAGEINNSMPDFVVMRAMEVLNQYGKAMRGSKILLLGLAYKQNVDDDRESPSYHLIEKLEAQGAEVFYNDPFVPEIKMTREFPQYAGRKSVPIETAVDLVILATAHDAYRVLDPKSFGSPVLDTRGVFRGKFGIEVA
jgi:UDP-N-acetyl-D-glucosamine dehydrogenase